MFAGISADHKKSSSGQFDCKGKTVSRIQHLVQIAEGKGVTAEQVQAQIEKTKQQQKSAKTAFGKGPFAGGGAMGPSGGGMTKKIEALQLSKKKATV